MPTRKRLLEEGLKLEPLSHGDDKIHPKKTIKEVGVISDIVGRRPTRHGGMRIEIEERRIPHPNKDMNCSVIHAYGAGGRGYEISWGVANEVLTLASPLLARL